MSVPEINLGAASKAGAAAATAAAEAIEKTQETEQTPEAKELQEAKTDENTQASVEIAEETPKEEKQGFWSKLWGGIKKVGGFLGKSAIGIGAGAALGKKVAEAKLDLAEKAGVDTSTKGKKLAVALLASPFALIGTWLGKSAADKIKEGKES